MTLEEQIKELKDLLRLCEKDFLGKPLSNVSSLLEAYEEQKEKYEKVVKTLNELEFKWTELKGYPCNCDEQQCDACLVKRTIEELGE